MENFTNPKAPTLAITYDTTISSSTSVSIVSGATYIEVTAMDKSICMKWGATASTSSYDELIVANSTRTYIIPSGVTTVQFIEAQATAILSVIQK